MTIGTPPDDIFHNGFWYNRSGQLIANATGSQIPSVSPSTGGLSASLLQIANVCLAGDSIAQQSTTVTGGSYNYNGRGEDIWAMMELGWPWQFEPADNFAVFGSTLDAIIATQLPAILTANATKRYVKCFLSAGTNDTNAGTALATIKDYYTTLFDALLAVGITPVITSIRPRGIDGAMTNAKRQNAELNQWLYEQSIAGRCEYLDVGATYADNAAAFGNALTSMMYDSGTVNLHPNGKGANFAGAVKAAIYRNSGVVPALTFATQQSDVFDRTNNPHGVAFNNANPLLQGGVTAPTGMTTSGGVWSKVNRTLANGQVRSNPTCALAATTVHYLYDDWVATGAWGATQLQPGDIIEGRAMINLAGVTGIKNIQLRLSESDGVTSISHYCSYGTTDDLQLAIPGSKIYYLKTPRVAIRAYGGSGNASIFLRAEVETNGSGAGTYTVYQFEVRKVA